MKLFTSKTQKTGELGESIATKYLSQQGFVILERNFTCKSGEVDIIAQKNEKIYFFEVKSIKYSSSSLSSSAYNPFENVSREKIRRILSTVQFWTLQNQEKMRYTKGFQIDALAVYLDDVTKVARVSRLENINIL